MYLYIYIYICLYIYTYICIHACVYTYLLVILLVGLMIEFLSLNSLPYMLRAFLLGCDGHCLHPHSLWNRHCTYTCTHAAPDIYLYLCVCVCVYVCACVCVYAYVCVCLRLRLRLRMRVCARRSWRMRRQQTPALSPQHLQVCWKQPEGRLLKIESAPTNSVFSSRCVDS